MNRTRTLACALFVIAGVWPSLAKAQAVRPEAPRASLSDTLASATPSSARLRSLGVVPQDIALGTLRDWLRSPQRKNQPEATGLLLNSNSPSAIQCPMPVARRAPEAIADMPVVEIDTTSATRGGVKLSVCVNPLDRRP